MVICFMRVEVQETHFQMHYFKTLFTQNVECTRMLSYLSLNGSSKNQNLDFKSLPPHLLLQLDNAASDNKNRYVFMFLSLLTALDFFITIEVGFLLVGHTHEDIDGTYGRMSSNLKSKDIYSLPRYIFFTYFRWKHPFFFICAMF